MSSKHTPGPWAYQEDSDAYTHIVRGPGNRFICQLAQTTSAEIEANARLIAAAPELLGALSRAVRETEQFLFEAWLVRVCPSGDVDAVQRQWLESSDRLDFVEEWAEQIDAIAKATGETQCAS